MALAKHLTRLDIPIASYIVAYHLVVLIGLPLYLMQRLPSVGLVSATVVLLFLTGMSITAGYHRFYSHRAFSLNKAGEIFLLLFGTMAMQSSVAYWAHKHRLHHRYVDTEKDPHNIHEGFFHAHMGWLLKKRVPLDWSVIPDIEKNPLTRFQDNHYYVLSFGLNIAAFLLMGWLFSDFWGAFIIGWWTRILVLSHSTYFINSLAHTFGSRTYSKEQTAVNNALIALLTFGEGYHNYHHVFSSDYRNGVRWYQYDPTKWMIWIMHKLGMASRLIRVDSYTSKKKMIVQDKGIFLEALSKAPHGDRRWLEKKVLDLSESISSRIARIKADIAQYRQLKRAGAKRYELKKMKRSILELKQALRSEWKSWRILEREITSRVVLHHHH